MDEPSRRDGVHARRYNLGNNKPITYTSVLLFLFLHIRTLLCAYFDRLSLQVDSVRRLASRNSVSLKRFAEKLGRRKGPGLS